jgi:hypothetical protein
MSIEDRAAECAVELVGSPKSLHDVATEAERDDCASSNEDTQ